MVAKNSSGTTAPAWSSTEETDPPIPEFQGKPTTATARKVITVNPTAHTVVATTLAMRTRSRCGVRRSVPVIVFCRYSVVMQSTPMRGARNVTVRNPAPRRRRRSARV